MEKKYKLTDEIIEFYGTKLYRIEALRDFSNVKKGDKGGFVKSEMNLSHNGNCWVYDDAKVSDCAMILDNAKIYDDATVYGNAKIYYNAKIYGHAIICGNVKVYGNAKVFDNARVYSNAEVFDKAEAYGHAKIHDNAKAFGNAKIFDNAKLYEQASVYGNAKVCGNAIIKGDAKIENKSDYITFKNWWSSGRHFTWTRSNNMWTVGCFYGTGKELIEKAYKDSELSGREYERVVNYVESILKGR